MNNFQRNKPKRQTLIEDSSIIAEITNENQYLVAERENKHHEILRKCARKEKDHNSTFFKLIACSRSKRAWPILFFLDKL